MIKEHALELFFSSLPEGELVRKGATLKVKRGEQVVSFLVKSIDVNKVILAWVSTESESFEFEVKMSEMHEDK